jgi:RNA polymerase sigma-70 factor (ECF subfamily)
MIEDTTSDGHASRGEWIEKLLEQFEGALIRYAAFLTGDPDRARDVVQDTFLRLCNRDPSEVKGREAQWLFTVCRHRAFDLHRKEHRMQPLDEKSLNECPHLGLPPDATLERKEAADEVMQAVGTLPKNQQEVVRLKFQNGLSYQEISQVTRLSVGNVGFLLHTAMKRIRQQLRTESQINNSPDQPHENRP